MSFSKAPTKRLETPTRQQMGKRWRQQGDEGALPGCQRGAERARTGHQKDASVLALMPLKFTSPVGTNRL